MKRLCLILVLILALSVTAYAETAEPIDSSDESACVETIYGEGAYSLIAQLDDATIELTYLDGALIYDDFSSSEWGKDSFGYYNSIEGSEFFGMTVEAVMEILSTAGYTIELNEIPRFDPPTIEEE